MTKTITQRFWEKVRVEKPDQCWEWVASRCTFGYGHMKVDGRYRDAHVVSWFIHTGKWPTQQVLHSCDNPKCVNFGHLFEGTQLDNVRDCIGKGRDTRERGVRHPKAKLCDADIPTIRQLHKDGVSLRVIGKQFGVRNQTIDAVVKGETWSHIQSPS